MIAIEQVKISEFPAVVTANRCEVSQISVIPATGASGSVVLGIEGVYEATGKAYFVPVQGPITVAMTPEQYAEWGTDDTYAIDCLLDNLGLVRA